MGLNALFYAEIYLYLTIIEKRIQGKQDMNVKFTYCFVADNLLLGISWFVVAVQLRFPFIFKLQDVRK